MCTCIHTRELDYLQTAMHHAILSYSPDSTSPHLPFTKSSWSPLGLLYLPETALWMDWGGRLSVSFYFGPGVGERDSYCYCSEGLFSVCPDVSRILIVISYLTAESAE